MRKAAANKSTNTRGKLRIGDDWNAITIIALSQSNPLKAITEFVENSIDAGATQIDITRGREKGDAYLRIKDNGRGIPKNDEGIPNFKYVATHICDSIKRQLKTAGDGEGVQGEFGIGLLSFWTVGETLLMRSAAEDGKPYEMSMVRVIRATRLHRVDHFLMNKVLSSPLNRCLKACSCLVRKYSGI